MSTYITTNCCIAAATRKRKRESGKYEVVSPIVRTPIAGVESLAFTNNAFSSTPKKLIGRRRIAYANKENIQLNCTKTGNQTDQLNETNNLESQPKTKNKNLYEVIRKPDKKRKKQVGIEEACFENKALNLEIPEKLFNPYEVVRDQPDNLEVKTERKCFVNEALNLRFNDEKAMRNPFEIYRCSAISAAASNTNGIENPVLDIPVPTKLQIGLPFKPTVNCRIDFENTEVFKLESNELLTQNFSPVPKPKLLKKALLGSIKEETSVDIGIELDRYQLELENSINEAKLRKGNEYDGTPTINSTFTICNEKKFVSIKKFNEINDNDLVENVEVAQNNEQKIITTNELSLEIKTHESYLQKINNDKVLNSDDEDEFRLSTNDCLEDSLEDCELQPRFIRGYRKSVPYQQNYENKNDESLQSTISIETKDNLKISNVKNLIRKSICKLRHQIINEKKKTDTKNATPENSDNVDENLLKNDNQHHNLNLISTIRQSLRRKTVKKSSAENYLSQPQEISIIDINERKMKFKSSAIDNELVKIGQLTNEKRHSIRNIRSSARDVMKSIFNKKQEAYTLSK